jgi:HSP20 family molecular chaperone IbpA
MAITKLTRFTEPTPLTLRNMFDGSIFDAMDRMHQIFAQVFGSDVIMNEDYEKSIYPKCDVYDVDGGIEIVATVPGLNLEDITVKAKDGKLKIKIKKQEERKGRRTSELVRRESERVLNLTKMLENFDETKIEVRSCRDGYLTIFVPGTQFSIKDTEDDGWKSIPVKR